MRAAETEKRSKRGFNFSSCPWIIRVIRQSPANLPGRARIYTAGQPSVKAERKAKVKRQKAKEEAEHVLRSLFYLLPFYFCLYFVAAASPPRRAT
jgi:hypothetical protein